MDETDERIEAWERIAKHPFFRGAYDHEAPLIDSMESLLDRQCESVKHVAMQAEEPVEWRILRAFTNGYAEGLRRGCDGRLDS